MDAAISAATVQLTAVVQPWGVVEAATVLEAAVPITMRGQGPHQDQRAPGSA